MFPHLPGPRSSPRRLEPFFRGPRFLETGTLSPTPRLPWQTPTIRSRFLRRPCPHPRAPRGLLPHRRTPRQRPLPPGARPVPSPPDAGAPTFLGREPSVSGRIRSPRACVGCAAGARANGRGGGPSRGRGTARPRASARGRGAVAAARLF